jgi:hypothetical protein
MILRREHPGIDPATLERAQCQLEFACLTDSAVCRTERFLDRDVELLRCLEKKPCRHKARYASMFVCSCPVKHARAV